MLSDQEEWLVRIEACSPDREYAPSVGQILEQSDLGGDIVHLVDGPSAITMTVAAFAQNERKAYQRVIARVRDTLGSQWTVQPSQVRGLLPSPLSQR